MKTEKGVTLLVLIITVIIMAILIGAGITAGRSSVAEVKLQNFSFQLQQVQGQVDSMREKMSIESEPNYISLNGKIIGQNINASEEARKTMASLPGGVDYSNQALQGNSKYYVEINGLSYSTYRYLSKSDLARYLNIKNAEYEVIVNFDTREVFSVKPFIYNEKPYYTRPDV